MSAANASTSTANSEVSQDSARGELNRYLTIVNDCKAVDGLEYWAQQKDMFSRLAPIAQDLLTVPASQACGTDFLTLRNVENWT